MNSVRELMQQAHMKSKEKAKPTYNSQKTIQERLKLDDEEENRSSQVEKTPDLPTGVRQIARDDIPVTTYGVKPVATNFNCYNKEVFQWLRDFSSNNQFNGGVPITKSQVIEIALDVLYYDLGIEPIGYQSQKELREAIQNKIKEM